MRSDNAFYQWMGHNIDFRTRTYMMASFPGPEETEGGTDYKLAGDVIKALHLLDRNGHDPITILMNNPGGDEYHGLAIFDAIKECTSHITIKVYGHAMSMGSIILQAADHRVMMPNAHMLLHYGTSGYVGHSLDFSKWAEQNSKLNLWMENLYLDKIKEKHPSFSRQRLRGMINFDKFLSAHEAVQLGLADEVDTTC